MRTIALCAVETEDKSIKHFLFQKHILRLFSQMHHLNQPGNIIKNCEICRKCGSFAISSTILC